MLFAKQHLELFSISGINLSAGEVQQFFKQLVPCLKCTQKRQTVFFHF